MLKHCFVPCAGSLEHKLTRITLDARGMHGARPEGRTARTEKARREWEKQSNKKAKETLRKTSTRAFRAVRTEFLPLDELNINRRSPGMGKRFSSSGEGWARFCCEKLRQVCGLYPVRPVAPFCVSCLDNKTKVKRDSVKKADPPV